MSRFADMPEGMAKHLSRLPLPEIEGGAFALGPPLAERRIAVVSSAGLGRRGDRPFGPGAVDYRVLSSDTGANDILMSLNLCQLRPDRLPAGPQHRLSGRAPEGDGG